MKDVSREIKRFLWQGRKSNNSKKIQMVNWETICRPKICKGAGVRDPNKMNLALGAKILWRILSGKEAWWKEILQKNI